MLLHSNLAARTYLFSNVNKKPDKIQSKGKATAEDIDMIEDD
jgi:hypothetical protein